MNVRNCGELGTHLREIVNRLLTKEKLIKLLFYTDDNPLSHTRTETGYPTKADLFEKLIKMVPIVKPETDQSIISLQITGGTINKANDEFRDIEIVVEIFCPFKTWFIEDTNLRPFAIMGELQSALRDKKVNGLGKIVGGDFELEFLTEELAAYKMIFNVVDYD